jgi:hypothetical protein
MVVWSPSALSRCLASLVCGAVVGCAAQPSAPTPTPAPVVNKSLEHVTYSTTMTCGELLDRLRGDKKADGGGAVLWLDGVYSGRSGLAISPAGWALTVSQAVGGICAINVNAARPVLDVIAEVHRQYGRN